MDILDLLEYQDHLTAKLKYIKYRPKKFDNPIQKYVYYYWRKKNDLKDKI